MRTSTRTAVQELAASLSSGFAPKGEACFDAGKLLTSFLAEPDLYMVSIERTDGGGTEFVAVVAFNVAEAETMALGQYEGTVVGCTDLVTGIEEQYSGIATLTTGGF